MALLQITYVSRATERFNVRDLSALIEHASVKNRARGLTGAMYFAADRFIQVLEGQDAAVRRLYETILADPRHTEIETVAIRPIEGRRFTDWGMGSLPPRLAASAAKEALRTSRRRSGGWSDETLDRVLNEFEAALDATRSA